MHWGVHRWGHCWEGLGGSKGQSSPMSCPKKDLYVDSWLGQCANAETREKWCASLMWIICHHFQLTCWGRVSQSSPELTDMANHLALGIPCLCFLKLELPMDHHTHQALTWISGHPNSNPHAFLASKCFNSLFFGSIMFPPLDYTTHWVQEPCLSGTVWEPQCVRVPFMW